MMTYSVTATPKSHYTNDNNFLPTVLDLEELESLIVIEAGEQYTVIDRTDNRLYSVTAESPFKAVEKYINWVYGEMYIYEWNSVEGGWDRTEKQDLAGNWYEYNFTSVDMTVVQGDE